MQGMCHLSKPMSASRPETHFYKVRHETANSVRTLALVQVNKKTPSSKCGYRKKQKKQKNFQSATPKCFFFFKMLRPLHGLCSYPEAFPLAPYVSEDRRDSRLISAQC